MLNNIAILVVVMETKISAETSKIKKYMDVEKNVSLIC